MGKRNDELVSTKATFSETSFEHGLNVVVDGKGQITRRKGYNTFGEMVDVLWNINKDYKKRGLSGEYTVRLPLNGIKPVYKKTLTTK